MSRNSHLDAMVAPHLFVAFKTMSKIGIGVEALLVIFFFIFKEKNLYVPPIFPVGT